jgi:hypothetical protein
MILDELGGDGEVRTLDVAHWLCDVQYEGDTPPTRTQIESARRALKRLEREGRLTSTLEATDVGPPWRQRWYRLAPSPAATQEEGTK